MQALRPVFALFARSLREESRNRLPTLLRTALVLLILLILWSNQRSFTNRAAPGREFFLMVMMLNLAFIGVAALSIFPSAITEEKEDETLPLLRMTNLSPLAILLGKSTSRFCSALLLLAVQVPFTLLAFTLGGVRLEHIWQAYAILAATTFFLCNLGLLCSVYSRTTLRAGFLTALIGGTLYIVLPFIAMWAMFRSMGRGIGAAPPSDAWIQFWTWILQANPVFTIASLLEGNPMAIVLDRQVWISLGAGGVLFLLSWLIFDRCCTQPPDAIRRPVRRRTNGRPRRFVHVTRPWSRFPVAWKDFYFLVGGRFGLYLRLMLATAIFAGIFWLVFYETGRRYYYYNRLWQEVAEMVLVTAMLCAGVELLLLSGRIFGVERRRQTISSLVGLPWTVGKIIRQKLITVVAVLMPWALLAAAGLILIWEPLWRDLVDWFRDPNFWKHDGDDVAAAAYSILQGVLLLVLIVWFSLRIRRGAIPCAAVIITVWNILFVIWLEETMPRAEINVLGTGILLSLAALIWVGRATYRRVELAAAED